MNGHGATPSPYAVLLKNPVLLFIVPTSPDKSPVLLRNPILLFTFPTSPDKPPVLLRNPVLLFIVPTRPDKPPVLLKNPVLLNFVWRGILRLWLRDYGADEFWPAFLSGMGAVVGGNGRSSGTASCVSASVAPQGRANRRGEMLRKITLCRLT